MPLDLRQDYQYELDQREKLRSTIATPITLLTLLGSLLAYMFQKFSDAPPLASTFFWGGLAVASIALLVSATYLARVAHGFTYKRLASAAELRQYLSLLRAWYARNPTAEGSPEAAFDEYLEGAYAIASTHNAHLNAHRFDNLYVATRFLIYAAIATGLSLVPFAYKLRTASDPIQKFELVNPIFILSPPKSSMSQDQDKKPQEPPKVPPADPKPSGPPLQDLKEGYVPQKR